MQPQLTTGLRIGLLCCLLAVTPQRTGIAQEKPRKPLIVDSRLLRSDPNDLRQLCSLLLAEESIAEAVGVGPEEIEVIRKLLRPNTDESQFKNAFHELLTADQIKRLKQIAFQVEIARLGPVLSIAFGHYGREIGITEEQKSEFLKVAFELEKKLEADILQARLRTHEKILHELSTEQRKKANALLGKYFHYDYVEKNTQSAKSQLRSQ